MAPTPENWERVKALFEAALEQAPEGRASFLRSSGADKSIVVEVERLLSHYSEDEDLPSSPVHHLVKSAVIDNQMTFSPEKVLASRFRIKRFIARGGMGEVYEAEDLELHETVAVKTIAPEVLAQPHALERFKREVLLAKKVTHPNVCRIFDLFRHTTSPDSSVVLVSMELLHGDTLTDHLKQVGRMTGADALPLALQMASGLAAAHDIGILHRDFKPGNVVLVPSAKGTRAVITDFGLAFQPGENSMGVTTATTSAMFGTPAYMSPEQVEGRPLTPASDVYTLGLVLYQMVTGTRPFDDPSPLSMAVRRVTDTPPSPRSVIPILDSFWETLILRCLERDPSRRFHSASEVAKAIEEVAVPAPKTKAARIWTLGICAAALAAACLVAIRLHQRKAAGRLPIQQRRSVAVLGLRNLSGRAEVNWISTAAAEMLNSELAADGAIRTIPAEDVARAEKELGLAGRDTLSKETLSHVHENLNSDFVVVGSYLDLPSGDLPSGSQVRVDFVMQDASTGNTLASVTEKGSEAQIDALISAAGNQLRSKSGMSTLSPGVEAFARASLPANSDATRFYSEGLAKLRAFDALGSRDLLERAISADPHFAPAHSALSSALSSLGYDSKARDEAKRAVDFSSNLSEQEQLSIKAKYDEVSHQWDQAVETYGALFKSYPDELEYGLRLLDALDQSGKPKEGLAELAKLRNLPPPLRDDPRIDLAEAFLADTLDDLATQQAAAARAVAKSRQRGTNLLTATALEQECRAVDKLGKGKESLAYCDEAERMFGIAGDRNGVAIVLNQEGATLVDLGDLTKAKARFEQSLAAFREMGNKKGISSALNHEGYVAYAQGGMDEAVRCYQEALNIQQELGNAISQAKILVNLGDVYQDQGKLAQAAETYQQAIGIYRQAGARSNAASALIGLAEVSYYRGQPDKARELLSKESIPVLDSGGQKIFAIFAHHFLAYVLLAEGDIKKADDEYVKVLDAAGKIGQKNFDAQFQVADAEVLIEEGRFDEAVAKTEKASKEFEQASSATEQVWASGVLARALLAQGKLRDAEQAVTRGRVLLPKTQSVGTRLEFMVDSARILAASRQAAVAKLQIRQTIAEAKRLGFVNSELRARFAQGEIEARWGDESTGKRILDEVAKEARSKGFGLIAAKAAKTTKSARD